MRELVLTVIRSKLSVDHGTRPPQNPVSKMFAESWSPATVWSTFFLPSADGHDYLSVGQRGVSHPVHARHLN